MRHNDSLFGNASCPVSQVSEGLQNCYQLLCHDTCGKLTKDASSQNVCTTCDNFRADVVSGANLLWHICTYIRRLVLVLDRVI